MKTHLGASLSTVLRMTYFVLMSSTDPLMPIHDASAVRSFREFWMGVAVRAHLMSASMLAIDLCYRQTDRQTDSEHVEKREAARGQSCCRERG